MQLIEEVQCVETPNTETPSEQTKRCSYCKIKKPLKDFHKDKGRKDGLAGQCKQCRCEHMKIINEDAREAKTIESFSQIDSVLRVMSESKYIIKEAREEKAKKIKIINDSYSGPIEREQLRISFWMKKLKEFLKNKGLTKKGYTKSYQFGTVSFSRGKLTVNLNPILANDMRNKP